MHKLFAPAALVLSLAVGSAAFAATAPAAPAAPTAHAKKAACEKAWKAQKTHTGTEKDFLKARVAKG